MADRARAALHTLACSIPCMMLRYNNIILQKEKGETVVFSTPRHAHVEARVSACLRWRKEKLG
ncbi:MAG: hypothetical protein I4O49_19805 [Janthinobacterium lividum]|nr:hypothetical protein [Janthinobacterium lividum]